MYPLSWTSHLVAMHDNIGNRSIVPQLDTCIKLKPIQRKKDCTLFKITPRNAISFRHVSSWGTIENHLTLLKERHILDEDRVHGIFNPQPRRRRDARDAVLVLGTRF